MKAMAKVVLVSLVVGSGYAVYRIVTTPEAPSAPEGDLELAPLVIEPADIYPGTRVFISGIVTNNGELQAPYVMEWYVDGARVGRTERRINPGNVHTNSSDFYPQEAGSYAIEVTVNGLRQTGTIMVMPSPAGEPDFQIPSNIIVLDPINVGEGMYATIILRNVGEASGNWSADWYLNEVFQETDSGILGPGSDARAYLLGVMEIAGHYEIRLVVTWNGHAVERAGSFDVI
ncbi:hypothetical protein ES703_41919 [subsurface metagenome]